MQLVFLVQYHTVFFDTERLAFREESNLGDIEYVDITCI